MKDHKDWCLKLFTSLNQDAVWTLPRSGVIFQRTDDLTLTWIATIPPKDKTFLNWRNVEQEFSDNVDQFGRAGIFMTRAKTLQRFDSYEEVERRFKILKSEVVPDDFQTGTLADLDFSGLDVTRVGDSLIVEKSGPKHALSWNDTTIRTERPARKDHSIAKTLLRPVIPGTKADTFNHAGLPHADRQPDSISRQVRMTDR